ncbi:MAG TPA: hypothetical protein VFE47_19675 [Tepidisphaeraceae bacterium]|jgi:pectate lyase|nr:hypothetical protein [Tepidisphaeraceae bacterium]
MSQTPSTLLAPAVSAYPKYAGVLNALGALITLDPAAVAPASTPAPAPTPVSAPTPAPPSTPTPSPAPIPAPTTANPSTLSVIAGRAIALAGDGTVCTFDFGDTADEFNALRGYNAAHVYDKPGTYVAKVTPSGKAAVATTVTVTADTRPTITLAPTDDLTAALGKLKAPTIVLLPRGATYNLKAPANISLDGITLRAMPATSASAPAPRICRLAAAGVFSTLVIGGADISIEGIEFDSDQPLKPAPAVNGKVSVYALNIMGQNLLVRNCNFRNVDDALHCEPQARGLVAIDCTFTDELRSCAAYLDAMQNVTLLGLKAAGSVCEHIIRLEGAQNVLVSGCDIDNKDGKETIAIRMGTNVSIAGNTLRAWARISEGTAAAPSVYCKNILFATNHFAGLRPDGPWLQINPGSQKVLIDANTFDVDATQVAIAVQAPVTALTLTNNELSRVNGATSSRALVDPFGNPGFVETGTTTG